MPLYAALWIDLLNHSCFHPCYLGILFLRHLCACKVAVGLTTAEVVLVAGNACSVPVMGSVLVQVILACLPAFLPCQAWAGHSHADTLQELRGAALSTEIAWLQAETSALKREREWVEELTLALIRRRR